MDGEAYVQLRDPLSSLAVFGSELVFDVLKQDARMPHAQNPEYNIALVTHVCPVVWRGLSG